METPKKRKERKPKASDISEKERLIEIFCENFLEEDIFTKGGEKCVICQRCGGEQERAVLVDGDPDDEIMEPCEACEGEGVFSFDRIESYFESIGFEQLVQEINDFKEGKPKPY